MQIAIVAAGFTPPEADKLRRAMATFKRVGTIGALKEKFINGMIARAMSLPSPKPASPRSKASAIMGFRKATRRASPFWFMSHPG